METRSDRTVFYSKYISSGASVFLGCFNTFLSIVYGFRVIREW